MVASDQLNAREAEATLKIEGRGMRPNVVQLAGCDTQSLSEAARVAEASGADVIDINMGCPSKRVVNGWAGAALMRDLGHATSLISSVRRAVRVPVTVKMRLGWDEESMNAPELARRAEEEGVCLVTVHGRTRKQFYTGSADWCAVRRVREAIRIPLVVNGDVEDCASAAGALVQSGAAAVMIGRAAVGRPWLVGQIGNWLSGGVPPQDPPPDVQCEIAMEHLAASMDHYGSTLGLRMVKKHLAAYLETALGEKVDAVTRAEVLGRPDAESTVTALRAFYQSMTLGRAA
jgi:nifR3 family TIM-barrel protein